MPEEQSPRIPQKRNKQPRASSTNDQIRGMYSTHDGGVRNFPTYQSTTGPMVEAKRSIKDATSDKEVYKAMSTFLNRTGAADYNLPKMTGEKVMVSNKRNGQTWALHDRTKLAWFPGRDVDFKGSSSPPATNYSPDQDRPYPNMKYSVGHFKRFHLPSSVEKLHKQIPHQYDTLDPGLITGNVKAYSFHRVAMGFGNKSDFTNQKQLQQVPGSKYNNHEINSISYQSKRRNPSSTVGFYNKYDKWERTCYKGMEHHFYMRETKGPGAYIKQDFVHTSPTQKASEFSVPKTDRGLLTFAKPKVPGPGNYENEVQGIKSRIKDPTFAMPKASRDISFAKYSSEHSHIVKKGLF